MFRWTNMVSLQYVKRVLLALFSALVLLLNISEVNPVQAQDQRKSVTGIGTVIVHESDEVGGGSKRSFSIELPDGSIKRLAVKRTKIKGLATGDKIKFSGRQLAGHRFCLRRFRKIQNQVMAATSPLSSVVSGEQKAIIVRVNFPDLPADCSLDQITGIMWTGDVNQQNVSSYYEEATYGAITFPPDTNQDGKPDIVDVSIDALAADGCDYFYGWTLPAEDAARAKGVNFDLYSHRIFVFPKKNLPCCWWGKGTLGCVGKEGAICRSWIRYCNVGGVYAHELGHSFGMHHARLDYNYDGVTDDEYGDETDIMGPSDGGYKHFNAPHKALMGWLPEERIQTVTETGVYEIAALEVQPEDLMVSTPTSIQAIRIPVEGQSNTFLYVALRSSKVGNYSDALSNTPGTHIYRHVEGAGYLSGFTDHIRAVWEHSRWYDGAGISIHQVSHTDSSASVEIKFDDFPPQPGATLIILSTPTPTPTKTPAASPTTTLTSTPTPDETATPSATPTPGKEHSYTLSIKKVPRQGSHTLRGALKDNGKAVTGAAVKLTYKKGGILASSKRFHIRSETQTNEKGIYIFPGIKRPGTYRAKALDVRSPVVEISGR